MTPINGFSCESPVLDVTDGLMDDKDFKYAIVPMDQVQVDRFRSCNSDLCWNRKW